MLQVRHGQWNYSDAAQHILLVIPHTKYTKRRRNDFNVYAQSSFAPALWTIKATWIPQVRATGDTVILADSP